MRNELANMMTGQVKLRVQAEYKEMLATCEATGWKAGFDNAMAKLGEFVAVMDKAVANNDLQLIRDALAEYRKPIRIDWRMS